MEHFSSSLREARRSISEDPVLNEAGSALVKYSVCPTSGGEEFVVIVVAVVVRILALVTFVVAPVFVIVVEASADLIASPALNMLSKTAK